MTLDRDWDAELAKIDKAMANWTPPVEEAAPPAVRKSAPAPAAPPPPPAPSAPPSASRVGLRHWAGTWARVGLGLLIGIGMTQWPYTHGCGFRFMFYLTGAALVPVVGAWSAWSTWKRRMGLAHFLSVGLLIWGLILVAREVLPRVGYAKQPATWFCPAQPAPQPSPPPPAQPNPVVPPGGGSPT